MLQRILQNLNLFCDIRLAKIWNVINKADDFQKRVLLS